MKLANWLKLAGRLSLKWASRAKFAMKERELNALVSDCLELMHFAAKAPLQSNIVNEEASSVESVSDK